MNVSEMHLSTLQRLQQVGAYKRDKFYPDEIDLALNKATHRLLEEGVANNFQGLQIRLSHVTALIQKNKILEIIQPQITDKLYEENIPNGYSVIPSDLYWPTNVRVEIITDPINCDTAPTLAQTNMPEYVAVVPFPALGSAPYFANTTVTSSVLGTLYTSPTAIAAGFTNSMSKYFVVGNILDKLYRRNPVLQVYWERYRDVYYPDSFIFVGSTDIGQITLTSNGQTSSVTRSINTYKIFNRALIPNLTSKEVTVVPIQLNQQDDLYNTLQNTFYKTSSIRPIADQTYDYFIIYTEQSFIVTRMYYDYIRKPRTISLLLSQDCELAPTIHPKVVDLAVEILKLDTRDPSYPATVQDTQLRTS